jgi:hypothetical protein
MLNNTGVGVRWANCESRGICEWGLRGRMLKSRQCQAAAGVSAGRAGASRCSAGEACSAGARRKCTRARKVDIPKPDANTEASVTLHCSAKRQRRLPRAPGCKPVVANRSWRPRHTTADRQEGSFFPAEKRECSCCGRAAATAPASARPRLTGRAHRRAGATKTAEARHAAAPTASVQRH